MIGGRNFVCKDKKCQGSLTIRNDTNKINAKATSDEDILVLESLDNTFYYGTKLN